MSLTHRGGILIFRSVLLFLPHLAPFFPLWYPPPAPYLCRSLPVLLLLYDLLLCICWSGVGSQEQPPHIFLTKLCFFPWILRFRSPTRALSKNRKKTASESRIQIRFGYDGGDWEARKTVEHLTSLDESEVQSEGLTSWPGGPGSPLWPEGPIGPMIPGSPIRPLSPWTPLAPWMPGSPCRTVNTDTQKSPICTTDSFNGT